MVLSVLGPVFMGPVFAAGGYYTTDVIDQTQYVDKYFEIDKDGHWKMNIYLGDQKIATIDDSGTTTYPLTDHLGSPTIITNQNAGIVEINDYESYGKVNYSNPQVHNDYKFTGKEQDDETNLQYYGARYLDNNLGRFNSIDPALFKLSDSQVFTQAYQRSPQYHLANPQNLNSYSYVTNNPVKLVDPNGELGIPAILGWIGLDFLFNINKAVAPGLDYNESQALQNQTTDLPSLMSESYNNLNGPQKLTATVLMTGGVNNVGKNLIGQKIANLGRVIANKSIKLSELGGLTKHGLDQIISREVRPGIIKDTLLNPLLTFQQSAGKLVFLSKEAIIVLNKSKEIITTINKDNFYQPIRDLIELITK